MSSFIVSAPRGRTLHRCTKAEGGGVQVVPPIKLGGMGSFEIWNGEDFDPVDPKAKMDVIFKAGVIFCVKPENEQMFEILDDGENDHDEG